VSERVRIKELVVSSPRTAAAGNAQAQPLALLVTRLLPRVQVELASISSALVWGRNGSCQLPHQLFLRLQRTRNGRDPKQPPATWGRVGAAGLLGWERPPAISPPTSYAATADEPWARPVPLAAASLPSVPAAQSRKEGGESAA
jgi:hypothetical protein